SVWLQPRGGLTDVGHRRGHLQGAIASGASVAEATAGSGGRAMNGPQHDRVDELLGRLPREIAPTRDLWPDIEAQLRSQAQNTVADDVQPGESPSKSWQWMRMAAGVVLVMGVCVTALVVTREQSPS